MHCFVCCVGDRFADKLKYACLCVGYWSALVTSSNRVRSYFRVHAFEKAERKSDVRWFSWWEVANQLRKHFSLIREIMRNPTFGNDRTRGKFNEIADVLDLHLELTMITDMGEPLVLFCYGAEGDGFLAPLIFDDWVQLCQHYETSKKFSNENTRAPLLASLVQECYPEDIHQQEEAFNRTIKKARPVWEKLKDDTQHRLSNQLQLFRFCRFFKYSFCALTDAEALEQELITLAPFAPNFLNQLPQLLTELNRYKERAVTYLQQNHPQEKSLTMTLRAELLWKFWQASMIQLPNWYKAAKEVALIMPSSAFVERCFSIYDSLFGQDQQAALHDRREAAVMLGVNNNQREKEIEAHEQP